MKARLHHQGLATALAASIALACPTAVAAPAGIEDPEAQEHFERAQQLFGEEDYAAAIPELKAAYALEPNPMLLYAWAQAERLAGSCARAVELYRRFIDTNPDAQQRQLAEANLLDCEAELPDVPPPQDDTDDDSADSPPDDEAGTTTDAPRPKWYADPVGGALAGSGLAFAITGGALMGVARSRVGSIDATTEDDHLRQAASATRMNTAGIVVLGLGGALLVGGAIRYALVARGGTPKGESARARIRPTVWGAGLGVTGSF